MDSVTIYTRFDWTCPDCAEVVDEGDVEPTGEVTCPDCRAVFEVGETR